MIEGSAKYVVGAMLGATGGFAAGAFVATPASRITGRYVLEGAGTSVRFLGRAAATAAEGLGTVLESAYTRVRGRETYLERQIEELREQISRLEQSSSEHHYPS